MKVGKYYKILSFISNPYSIKESQCYPPAEADPIVKCIRADYIYDVYTCVIIDDWEHLKKGDTWNINLNYIKIKKLSIKELRKLKINELESR
jgi:hypothetical protein